MTPNLNESDSWDAAKFSRKRKKILSLFTISMIFENLPRVKWTLFICQRGTLSRLKDYYLREVVCSVSENLFIIRSWEIFESLYQLPKIEVSWKVLTFRRNNISDPIFKKKSGHSYSLGTQTDVFHCRSKYYFSVSTPHSILNESSGHDKTEKFVLTFSWWRFLRLIVEKKNDFYNWKIAFFLYFISQK